MATPEEMEASMVANLAEKTGKPMETWIAHVHASGLEKHGQIVKHLKTEHGVTHGYANLIAHYARRAAEGGAAAAGAAPAETNLVEAQYAGAKADLRPIYDAVIARITGFGSDVEVSPKKTYVSLRRAKQFALVQPSTKTRVDVGIQLKGKEPGGRLEPSGSFNAMVSHRVRLESPTDVDDQLTAWLREAYDAAG